MISENMTNLSAVSEATCANQTRRNAGLLRTYRKPFCVPRSPASVSCCIRLGGFSAASWKRSVERAPLLERKRLGPAGRVDTHALQTLRRARSGNSGQGRPQLFAPELEDPLRDAEQARQVVDRDRRPRADVHHDQRRVDLGRWPEGVSRQLELQARYCEEVNRQGGKAPVTRPGPALRHLLLDDQRNSPGRVRPLEDLREQRARQVVGDV